MKRALVGGIGNVLLGDDAVGPYVVHLLEWQYMFGSDVELVDLGTPSLDLTHRIAGLHTLILIDSIATDVAAPGTVLQYHKEDILRRAPAPRLDPHSPALSECLLQAEFLGAAPANVLLVGIVGQSYESGAPLSAPVAKAVWKAVDTVIDELTRRGFASRKQAFPHDANVWWAAATR